MDRHRGCERLVEPPTFEEFFRDFLIPNRPAILGPRLVESWKAREKWVEHDPEFIARNGSHRSKIDWEYLSDDYGHHEVTVADCATRELSDQRRETMLFREVVDLWKSGRGNSLYVKDWHLAREEASNPSQCQFYTTPDIFRDDWMNAYYSACTNDDFRFVYVGAEGTFTPLHRDVYTSYSWSTNVCGLKRWWLFPPEQTPFLFRKGGEEHMETLFDVRQVDPVVYPDFAQTHPVVIDQEEGETIFVPSGWFHQVENLTACISINHNWCNASNLPSLYASMCAKVTEVENALEDVRELLSQNQPAEEGGWVHEWVQIVQDVVEKDAGWNWLTFWRMILHALRAATSLKCDAPPLADPGLGGEASAPLWQPAPVHLRPPLSFVKGRVKECYDDFILRNSHETSSLPHMAGLLQAVGELLE